MTLKNLFTDTILMITRKSVIILNLKKPFISGITKEDLESKIKCNLQTSSDSIKQTKAAKRNKRRFYKPL